MAWQQRRRRWALGASAGVVLFLAGAWNVYHQDLIRRYYSFAIYANALEYFGETHGKMAPDLPAPMKEYNAYDGRRWEIPVRPDDWPPSYRPCAQERGKYLLMIEPPPRHWYQLGRWVIYGHMEDWGTSVEHMWAWRLDDWVGVDDIARMSGPMCF